MNVGMIDRLARALIGIALLCAPLLNVPAIWASVALAYISMAAGLVLIATALFGFCPLYKLAGFSSSRH